MPTAISLLGKTITDRPALFETFQTRPGSNPNARAKKARLGRAVWA